MSQKRESYRIYRAMLYLYPKSHREAYGQQMVQTLDDILSDQQSSTERLIVWLRVTCELPINIIEENIHSMGGISVNKLAKITNKQYLYLILAILVVGSYAVMAMIWRHERTEISSLSTQLQTVSANMEATNGGNYTAATITPSESAVYFPLARLRLTASVLNEGLVYDYQTAYTDPGLHKVFPAQLDISTHDLSVADYSSTNQFDCSQVVYADFVTPSYPVNPMWKSDGSVHLADGRTMNVYYAPSIPGCEHAWEMNDVNSKAIADSLEQAVSY